MSNLISLDDISLSFGQDILLDHANLQITAGERICLIGRNGAGKSSLLKIIEGVLAPDAGIVRRKSHLRLARLEQELPQDVHKTVLEFVAEGLAEIGKYLAEYHTLIHCLSGEHTQADLDRLEVLQQQIDASDGWQFDQKITDVLERLELKPDLKVSELSGGWQRRAALAKALVSSPEVLLLDEPTNHLDIEAIQWLEDQLMNANIGLIFITHDRSLLQRLATRILELDRGQLTSWPGDYENFLRRKEEMLHAEEKQNAEFDKKLAQEEKWIRQGVKARRTRNEGRVRALKALRAERAKRREVQGKVAFNMQDTEKSGALVIEAEHISFKNIINDFSIRIMRGDHIGLVGPNGVGKTTLLNLLLGNLEPEQGKVTHGTKLQIAYFDQLRAALYPDKTVAENVLPGSDTLDFNGKPRHIISYLSDFLFTPQRALTQVKYLSGGECNRLLLARLFTKPANVLVLDEPTNDLDVETLELLEALLCDYKGTLLVVSHDRTFLDNVVSSTLVFEGQGKVQEYIGGYQDWLRQRKVPIVQKETAVPVVAAKPPAAKLSYKEQKELAALPRRIEQLEKEQAQLQLLPFSEQTQEKLAQVAADLVQVYERWEELEERKN